MAQNDKPSDVVRIVRIVSPTVLIIALALIFKSEISGSINRGCYEIAVKDIGVGFSDKSLCTANDINNLANELTQLGAQQVEEQASVAFAEYEDELRTLAENNKTLQEKNLKLAEVNNANSDKIRSFQRELQEYVRETRSQEFTQFYNAYVETFDPANLQTVEMTEIHPINEAQVSTRTKEIRSNYVKESQVKVESIKGNIEVRRK